MELNCFRFTPVAPCLKCSVLWLKLRSVTGQSWSKRRYSELVHFPHLRFEAGCATFHVDRPCQCIDIACVKKQKIFFLVIMCNHEFLFCALQLKSRRVKVSVTQWLCCRCFVVNGVNQWTKSSSFTAQSARIILYVGIHRVQKPTKYWHTSMLYALLDGYYWICQVLSSLLRTFFFISYCTDCKQDSRVSLPASHSWCRIWCWTGGSKRPILYPGAVFLSHALGWSSIRSHCAPYSCM